MAEGDGNPRWTPLESNPDALNKYIKGLGIPDPWHFVDIFGFDTDLLAFVPQPIAAIVFTFPDMPEYEKKVEELYSGLEADEKRPTPSDCFFMKQHIDMACGTYAVLHALANSPILDKGDLFVCGDGDVEFTCSGNGAFSKFFEKAKNLESPEEKSKCLAGDPDMETAHESCAQEGQTSPETEVRHHFICFLPKDGFFWEFGMFLFENLGDDDSLFHSFGKVILDSGHRFPRPLRPTSDETFLSDISQICTEIIKHGEADSLTFSAMALVGSSFD